jgi:2-polyprenyl-3-methyl-5-hydroxy-6-metoxy-1,4-benzoquinol methylase
MKNESYRHKSESMPHIVFAQERGATETGGPARWNTDAYEREWAEYPEYNDFMRPDSPVHQRKTFQAEIYARALAPWFGAMNQNHAVLDAGAGVGRMVPRLAQTGAALTLVDASARALEAAWRVLREHNARRYDLHCRDAQDLSCFPDASFDFCLALELLCYLDDPRETARELARVCRPGGIVAFSVENKTGAILGGSGLSCEDVDELLKSDELRIPGDLYVKYFTPETAAALAAQAGLRVECVMGCHYLADGPFHALATEPALTDPEKRERFHTVEEWLRNIEPINKFARAWLVVGIKI